MTLRLALRPVLACLAAATLAACDRVEADPHRFENMANVVAAIPLDGRTEPSPAPEPAARPAVGVELPPALKVEVMDPHALWDARDGGLRGMVEEQGQRFAAAAAPVVADSMVREVSARIENVAAQAGLRPGRGPDPAVSVGTRSLVQIGAYSSESAARAAWARLDLEGLTPVYEAVEVNGRRLTRLKVSAPAARAPAVCAAAGIDDPWCHRAG